MSPQTPSGQDWCRDTFAVLHSHCKRLQVGQQYFAVFLQTMRADWTRIDKLRLDKFMLLVRLFFRQLFLCMAQHAWCAELQMDTLRQMSCLRRCVSGGKAVHINDIARSALSDMLQHACLHAHGRPRRINLRTQAYALESVRWPIHIL